jgi:tetratricopeptide (TPR) repeat protein
MYRLFSCATIALLACLTVRPAVADDRSVCINGNDDNAVAACNRLLKRKLADADGHTGLGNAQLAKGRYVEAIIEYGVAINLDPKSVIAYYGRGNTFLAQGGIGDYDSAIADYNEAIRLNPRFAQAYHQRGRAYYLNDDYDRAIADYGEAIRLDPKPAAYTDRGQALISKGEHDRATADATEAIRLDPKYAVAWSTRANAYYEKGDCDRAIADYGEAIRLDPKYAAAYTGRGQALSFKGEYDRAIADLDQAVRLDPKYGLAYHNRGLVYIEKGDYDQAIADLQHAAQNSATISHKTSSHEGYAYGRMGNFEWAMPQLNSALMLNPKYARGYSNRAAILELHGDLDRAIADADKALKLDPRDWLAYNWRGKAVLDKGNYDRAIADFDQALKLRPAVTEARENRERAMTALAALSNPKPGAASPPIVSERPLGPSGAPERRVALVIGNAGYRAVPALANPRRDAQAVADALRQAGFQAVELATDLDHDGMLKALRSFRDKADAADWALVYFAGHGIEINRINYLIPVDAKLADDRDVKDETVSYEDALRSVGGARALRIVVLDACRNNPFREIMRRTAASRGSGDRGLAPPPEAEPGTLVVYSAKDGEVASDDLDGTNSPFARSFVTQLKVPGREVRRLFDYVRDDVLRTTNKRQQPFTYGSLPGDRDFFFVSAK